MKTNNPIYPKAKHERIRYWITQCPNKLQLASMLADYEHAYGVLYEENNKLKENYQRLHEEFDIYAHENSEAA